MVTMQLEAEVRTHDVVAQKTCGTRFFQRRFKAFVSLEDFTMDVVVAHVDAHRIGRNRHAFDHDVGVVHQDFAVLARAWLTLVRVADQVFLAWELAGHEAPLQTRGEACTTTTAQC